MKKRFFIFIGIAMAWGSMQVCAAGSNETGMQAEPLVIHFDSGKTSLRDADRATIRTRIGKQGLGAGDKILVVGHTDNSGDADQNFKLSRQRAQAVRKEIANGIGIDGKHVIAIGQADALPLGDNKTRAGRAMNRRVEIYLAQVLSEPLKGGDATNLAPDQVAAVEALVQDAGTRLRGQDIDGALRLLHTARGKGGDQVASWHAMFGMVGFYAGAPASNIETHLRTALKMDPFNAIALEFLGRLEAQEKVAAGLVTKDMGQDEQAPIPIQSDAQAHEYMRLFNVQALSHRPAKRRSVEMWTCQVLAGRVVNYYFERTGLSGWAGSP